MLKRVSLALTLLISVTALADDDMMSDLADIVGESQNQKVEKIVEDDVSTVDDLDALFGSQEEVSNSKDLEAEESLESDITGIISGGSEMDDLPSLDDLEVSAVSGSSDSNRDGFGQSYKEDYVVDVDGYQIKDLEAYRGTFLRDIPRMSTFISNDDFVINTGRQFVYFDDGNVKYKSPLKETASATYCYFKVKKNNSRFVIKGDKRKGMKIKHTTVASAKLEDGTHVNMAKFKFTDENPIDYFMCTSTEKMNPLQVRDFEFETGKMFKLKFTPAIVIPLYD